MNKWYSLFAITGVLFAAGCSFTEPVAEAQPEVTVVNGGSGESGKINDITLPAVPEEKKDPQPVTVPRVKQAQVIGVIRELRANGCLVKKVANTDGVHYSQLVVTCADPQNVPEVE